MPPYYFSTRSSTSSVHRSARRMHSVVSFSSLFLVQPHELFAHHSDLTWISSLGCPLMFVVVVRKCFTNMNALIFVLFTWACINSVLLIRSYETRIEVKNILDCMPRWRVLFSVHTGLSLTLLSGGAAQALPFHHHDSCVLLCAWQCPRCQTH